MCSVDLSQRAPARLAAPFGTGRISRTEGSASAQIPVHLAAHGEIHLDLASQGCGRPFLPLLSVFVGDERDIWAQFVSSRLYLMSRKRQETEADVTVGVYKEEYKASLIQVRGGGTHKGWSWEDPCKGRHKGSSHAPPCHERVNLFFYLKKNSSPLSTSPQKPTSPPAESESPPHTQSTIRCHVFHLISAVVTLEHQKSPSNYMPVFSAVIIFMEQRHLSR